MLDLEKLAERTDIDRSYDLRTALHTSRLKLLSHKVRKKAPVPVPAPVVVERVIEKHHHTETKNMMDEARLEEMMRKILSEQKQPEPAPAQPDSSNAILSAVAALNQKIESLQTVGPAERDSIGEPIIDPVRLAELKALAIERISKEIKTTHVKSGKKVILKNTGLSNLADELE